MRNNIIFKERLATLMIIYWDVKNIFVLVFERNRYNYTFFPLLIVNESTSILYTSVIQMLTVLMACRTCTI